MDADLLRPMANGKNGGRHCPPPADADELIALSAPLNSVRDSQANLDSQLSLEVDCGSTIVISDADIEELEFFEKILANCDQPPVNKNSEPDSTSSMAYWTPDVNQFANCNQAANVNCRVSQPLPPISDIIVKREFNCDYEIVHPQQWQWREIEQSWKSENDQQVLDCLTSSIVESFPPNIKPFDHENNQFRPFDTPAMTINECQITSTTIDDHNNLVERKPRTKELKNLWSRSKARNKSLRAHKKPRTKSGSRKQIVTSDQQKRKRANEQERKRMKDINDALKHLELCLPQSSPWLPHRRSKIAILRAAIKYIRYLCLEVYGVELQSPMINLN